MWRPRKLSIFQDPRPPCPSTSTILPSPWPWTSNSKWNYYQIIYKLLSDKPFQIILTNYYQTLLSTTVWEFIQSDSYPNFYKRTLETTLTNLLWKNHFKQYISTKSFQRTHYKLLTEKSLQTILTNYYQKIISNHIYMVMIYM